MGLHAWASLHSFSSLDFDCVLLLYDTFELGFAFMVSPSVFVLAMHCTTCWGFCLRNAVGFVLCGTFDIFVSLMALLNIAVG